MSDDTQDAVQKPAALIAAEKVEAVLEKYGHDIIGKAHAIFEELKALVAEAKGA